MGSRKRWAFATLEALIERGLAPETVLGPKISKRWSFVGNSACFPNSLKVLFLFSECFLRYFLVSNSLHL